MLSKDPIQRFADILENIILIEEFARGMDLDSYRKDLKTHNATERRMNGSVKLRRNWGKWRRNCVPMFRGPACVPWQTS